MEQPDRISPQVTEIPAVIGSKMLCYRCFFLKSSGGVDKADIVDAAGDRDALFHAFKLLEPQSDCVAVEIWEGARKVFPVTRARAGVEQLKRALSAMS